MKEAILLRLYLLVVSSVLLPFYTLALLFGLIRIKGWDLRKFFPGENGLITVSNHITTVETVLIPLLLSPFFICWLRLLIVSVAKKKWYNKWWFSVVRPAAIMVSPGEGVGAEEAMKPAISFLKKGKKILHIYPSGMRLKSIKKANKEVITRGDREMGRFHSGLLVVLLAAKSDLLPMWIGSGKWPLKPLLTINIGKKVPYPSLGLPDAQFSELTDIERKELLIRLEDISLEA